MTPATSKDIESVFNRCFRDLNVVLQGGAAEPYYQPAADKEAVLTYREDFAASALHEISHWCIAGKARLLLPDFGYWYRPDGRTQDEQSLFYQVEVKPQALEWIFSELCGIKFTVSADNLSGNSGETKEGQRELALFEERVRFQRDEYRRSGLPPRAAAFAAALTDQFQ